MPFLQIAVFDAGRAERDDGNDDRLLYQEHFRIHDKSENCGIIADSRPTDFTGWFLGLSSLAPIFGASDKAALRFISCERAICATLNPCQEVWIAMAFVYGNPLGSENNNNNTTTSDAACFAAQVFRDLTNSTLAHFFRSHLRALEGILRSVCGSPLLWGGPIMIPKAKRKELVKKGIDLVPTTTDPREMPADKEVFREVCDLFGCHLSRLIGSIHTCVKKGSDASSLFFGFPTIRSTVKIALGTGGRARIAQLDVPVILLIDGMLAMSVVNDDAIARNLVLVNNLFPSSLKDGSLFFSSSATTTASNNKKTTNNNNNSNENDNNNNNKNQEDFVHPGLINVDGKPECWKVVRFDAVHEGILHSGIGLVPLDLYYQKNTSVNLNFPSTIVQNLRTAVTDLVNRSKTLSNTSSVLSYKNAPRFRFSEPSLQFSWSSPGYASASSTLWSSSSPIPSLVNSSSSTNSASASSQQAAFVSPLLSPSSKSITSPSSSSSSSSSTATERARQDFVANAERNSFSLNSAIISNHHNNNNNNNNNGTYVTSPGSVRSSDATSPASVRILNRSNSPRNSNNNNNNTVRQQHPNQLPPGFSSANGSSSSSMSSNPQKFAALLPIVRACCTLASQMAMLTEKANDNNSAKNTNSSKSNNNNNTSETKIQKNDNNDDDHQQEKTQDQPAESSTSTSAAFVDRKVHPAFIAGIPDGMKPFTFEDFFAPGATSASFFEGFDEDFSSTTTSRGASASPNHKIHFENNNKPQQQQSSSSNSTTMMMREREEDVNWKSPVADLNSNWFSKDDLTYKVDDYSWATIKVIGGRAVGVMVLCADPNGQSDPLPIEQLIHQSNAISLLTFDDVHCTTYDYS